MKRIILIGPSTFGAMDKSPIEKLTSNGFEIKNNPYGRKLSKNDLRELLPGIDGLIAGLETLDKEILAQSQLKIISRCGAGLNNVDLDTARELGIKVYSTPNAPTQAVAELTVGSLLALLRLIPKMDRNMHKGEWTKEIGVQLKGKTILIIGFGRIGRRVAELLRAFGVKILVVDPFLKVKGTDFELLSIEEALPQADIISLHISGEEEVLGAKEFKLVKKGAYLLNSARGGVINEAAMIDLLDRGQIAGAWLDTFLEEPYKGPLVNYEQVIITPHVGSYTRECRRQMEEESVNNLISGFEALKR